MQVKEELIKDVQKTVANAEEQQKQEHTRKLRLQNNEVLSLEEIE